VIPFATSIVLVIGSPVSRNRAQPAAAWSGGHLVAPGGLRACPAHCPITSTIEVANGITASG